MTGRDVAMFDVAIIGCGPVGALAANLLGKAGLKTLVVERELDPYPLPRAVHLDHEMMRLFQAAGVIDRVKDDMRDTSGHLHIGADHGVIRYMGTVGKPRPFGWSNDYFFYQPELEDHLRDGLLAHDSVDLRLGTEFKSLAQRDDHVELTLASAAGETTAIARWVIACDGSRSAVRKFLGIALDDLQFEEPWLVVDAEVGGPVRFPPLTGVPEEADLQQLSVMMCDPERPMTIVPGPHNYRRWEIMLLPGESDEEMMRPEKVRELINPWLEGIPHKIVRAATYRFHGLIAEQWQQGNVFLAGDAAHQTPPFFGQGMCHGMRDVANLAWKMALVVAGKAGPDLLATYQLERDPHVRSVISAAVNTGRYICLLDKDKAAQRDAEIREKARRNELPTTAADLIPAIDFGIVASDTANAGRRFIQPFVTTASGKALLDDVVPGDWRLFAIDADATAEARAAVDTSARDLDIAVIDASALADNNAVRNWLAACGVRAVLVRPDFYVFGTAGRAIAPLVGKLADLVTTAHDRTEKIA